jgi:hypothetical protein
MVGGSAGPLPGGWISSSITLEDGFAWPDADNLTGPATLTSIGGALGPWGYSVTAVRLGEATGAGGGTQSGLDLGVDGYGGISVLAEPARRETCCSK